MPAPTIHIPNRPLPGMQNAGFHQRFRVGTCEEADCEWFEFGRDGMDDGAPFTHPAGVRCGDTARCSPCATPRPSGRLCGNCAPCKAGTANCPCPQRVNARDSQGRRGHLVPDTSILPVLSFTTDRQATRVVTPDEFMTRLHEGADSLHHILTRGL